MITIVAAAMFGATTLLQGGPEPFNTAGELMSAYEQTTLNAYQRAAAEEYTGPLLVADHQKAFARLSANLNELSLADEDLHRFFTMGVRHAFVVETDDAVSSVAHLYDQLVRRNIATSDDVESLYRLLIANRRWAGADELAATRSDVGLKPRPAIQSTARRTEYRYGYSPSVDGAWLRETPLMDHAGTGLVVSVHPSCQFSRDALDAVFADKGLAPLMREAVLLLSPYTDTLDGKVAAWNAAHPDQPMRYAIHKRDWPEISYWGTPSFYFLKDGEVLKKVVGWRKDESGERKAALLEGFRLIGVEPPADE